MNLDLIEQLSGLDFEENVIVEVNSEIKDAMALLLFQEQSLELELNSVRENRYGFYNRDHVIEVLAKLEDKRIERLSFLDSIGEQLLGDNYRQVLDDYGVEFQIDTALPVIIFFKRPQAV